MPNQSPNIRSPQEKKKKGEEEEEESITVEERLQIYFWLLLAYASASLFVGKMWKRDCCLFENCGKVADKGGRERGGGCRGKQK